MKGPCETLKPWFLFTARLDAGAHVRLHLGYVIKPCVRVGFDEAHLSRSPGRH